MDKKEPNKPKALYILKILKEKSDDKHPITQTDIINELDKVGITCNRKTVSRTIDALIEFGFNITKIIGGGCYYVNDTFDNSEITYLVDCVYSSPAISQKQAESLIDRLTENISFNERKKYQNIFKSDELIRTDNRQVFWTIDRINEAIRNNKQISFNYNLYGKEKTLKPRKADKYIINPYYTINSKGKYFLVCNKDNYDNIANYRIDYMTDVEILDTPRKEPKSLVDGKQLENPIKYANEHIYMFAGTTKTYTIKLYNERMLNEVIDWFGKDIKIVEEEPFIVVKLKANENAIIYWALQYGQFTEILEPTETRKQIGDILESMIKRYK